MSHPIQTAFKGTGAVGSALFAVISPSLGDLSEATRVIGAIVAIFGSIAFTASMCLDVAKKTLAIRKELFQSRGKGTLGKEKANGGAGEGAEKPKTESLKMDQPTLN